MTNVAYAARNPAATRQPRAELLPLSFGVLYPQNDLVAIVDDEPRAEQAASALSAAGISGEQVDVVAGRTFLALIDAAKRQRSLLGRIGAFLSRLFSDDAEFEQSLIDAAREDHALLVVHTTDATPASRLGELLRANGAHNVRYYGRGSIEDLS